MALALNQYYCPIPIVQGRGGMRPCRIEPFSQPWRMTGIGAKETAASRRGNDALPANADLWSIERQEYLDKR
jgi:hypothetical protein